MSDRSRWWAAAGVVAAVAVGGCATGTAPSAAPVAAPASSAAAPPSAAPGTVPATSPLPGSAPVGLSVDAIGVRTARLVGLGLARSGAMEVPVDAPTVGWFELGPTPGEAGPAVLAAHVDYAGADGAFVRLADLRPGDQVEVRRADGTTAAFTAYRAERFAKSAFPTEEVYGDTDGAELRLITCGGRLRRRERQLRRQRGGVRAADRRPRHVSTTPPAGAHADG